MGAWIETITTPSLFLPLTDVAPRMGAWIETDKQALDKSAPDSRAPHGRVD